MNLTSSINTEATVKNSDCCSDKPGAEKKDVKKFDNAMGDAKSDNCCSKDKADSKASTEPYDGDYDSKKTDGKSARGFIADLKERQEIKEDMQELDAKLFEMEQSGDVSHKDLEEVKEQYAALKERVDDYGEEPGGYDMPDRPIWSGPREPVARDVKELVMDKLSYGDKAFDKQLDQMDARIDRLEDVANGKEVPDRTPDGAIRVDHHYNRQDDSLMDTSMVPAGKDADGYDQFVSYSPTEQTKPEMYYRDEAGNFTTNRNEAVKEFEGVATDPSILPDNAILDDKGNYWMPTGADKDGDQTFRPLRSGDELGMARAAVVERFYQDADGNFSRQKPDDAISAEDFEKSQWEPQIPEGAIPINIDGDGKMDFHMVPIGADESGQERYLAVQQDNWGDRAAQQIYTRNEDGSFETLDGEPLEAMEKPEPQMYYGQPFYRAFDTADG